MTVKLLPVVQESFVGRTVTLAKANRPCLGTKRVPVVRDSAPSSEPAGMVRKRSTDSVSENSVDFRPRERRSARSCHERTRQSVRRGHKGKRNDSGKTIRSNGKTD